MRRRSIGATRPRGRGPPRHDVLRRFERRIDPSAPRTSAGIADGWQIELQQLPICVQDQIDADPLPPQFRLKGEAVGMLAPVRLPDLDAMPGLARLPEQLI